MCATVLSQRITAKNTAMISIGHWYTYPLSAFKCYRTSQFLAHRDFSPIELIRSLMRQRRLPIV